MRKNDSYRCASGLVLGLLLSALLSGCSSQEATTADPPPQSAERETEGDSAAGATGDAAFATEAPAADMAAAATEEADTGEADGEELASPYPTPLLAPRAIRHGAPSPDGSPSATAAWEPKRYEPANRNPLRESPAMAPELEAERNVGAVPRSAAIEPMVTESTSPDAPLPPADDKPEANASLPYTSLTVFYATDRQNMSQATAAPERQWLLTFAILICLTLLAMVLGLVGSQRRLALSLATLGALSTLALGAYWVWDNREALQQVADPGVRYGNERGEVEYGTCEVTIPVGHEIGEVERPTILRLEVREDVARHVVLQSTRTAADEEFFEQLRNRVESATAPEVFIFVHGYNVTFDGAARRTAQIAHDVQFAGAPIFFSWPSQGGLLKYTVDENNVEWAVPHLRQFLLDVTQRSGAKSVNLIAHSMGNRALTAALRELKLQLSDEAVFNQIILAAPDIDAEIFKRDLAPALVQLSRHVTLYASSNDNALIASKQVHGYPRAGDSGAGLVVLPGIETIDVSTLDTSLLGHSYYGNSDPILVDIRQMIQLALPAAQRPFLLPRPYGDLTYWVFEKIRTTATRDRTRPAQ